MAKKGKPQHDGLEQPGDRDAVPEEITSETSYSLVLPKKETVARIHPDRDELERADTDRDELEDDGARELLASEVPASLTFVLRAIPSMSASCFFCGKKGCDQVFTAKSRIQGKTKAWAVHNQCVFDHTELQVIASGGT